MYRSGTDRTVIEEALIIHLLACSLLSLIKLRPGELNSEAALTKSF